MKKVITYGTFDLLHYGHINLLQRAKALGDYLIVALSTDEFNSKEKNKITYFSYEERKRLLEAIRYVDLVIPEQTEVATLAWGQALGSWAMFVANIFALCAMMTSYWAVGGSMLTNIVDMFKFKSENHVPTRLISLACVALPPFILAYSGLVSFVDAIYLAGTFGGVIMSILPALMVNSARKNGDMEPPWKCGWYSARWVQVLIITLFCAAALYAVLDLVGILPSGW